jgi:hypothetical protein
MRSFAIPIVIAAATALSAVGCGGTGAVPTVPSITRSVRAASVTGGQGNGGAGSDRVAAVHAAAQCIREHGIPSYPDPALSADGNVYSDLQSYRLAPQSTFDAIQRACGALLATAASTQARSRHRRRSSCRPACGPPSACAPTGFPGCATRARRRPTPLGTASASHPTNCPAAASSARLSSGPWRPARRNSTRRHAPRRCPHSARTANQSDS